MEKTNDIETVRLGPKPIKDCAVKFKCTQEANSISIPDLSNRLYLY